MAVNEEFTHLIDGTVANMPGGYSVHEEINEDKKNSIFISKLKERISLFLYVIIY